MRRAPQQANKRRHVNAATVVFEELGSLVHIVLRRGYSMLSCEWRKIGWPLAVVR